MKKVLLVDDDPFILGIYAQQLKQNGYVTDVADNLEKALDKIDHNTPDVMVLDLNLGKQLGPKDGIDLLRRIRQDSRVKDMKVIVMSNYSEKDYAELSTLPSFGVMQTLVKVQATPQDLIAAIHYVVQ